MNGAVVSGSTDEGRRRVPGTTKAGGWRSDAIAAILVLASAAGCIGPGGKSARSAKTERLDPQRTPESTDIPLPAGFELVERSGDDITSEPPRRLRRRYLGRAWKPAAVRFYRNEMPLVRWVLQDEDWTADRAVLRFAKGDELCTVSIAYERRKGQFVTIEVIITPADERDAGRPN